MRARAAALALASLLTAAHAGAALAAGLVDDFRAALAHDPSWQAAIATRDAGVEALERGRAGLLPQVSISAARGKASTDRTLLLGNEPTYSKEKYDTYNYALQLRQPLFRMRNWAAYEQGKAQAAYAEENLRAARQELALRVVAAYADWAAASADAETSASRISAQDLLLRVAERGRQGGDATRIDVEFARSRLAEAHAEATDAQGRVQAATLNWRQLTGREGPRASVPAIGPDIDGRLRLDPAKLDDWQAMAISVNGEIRALRYGVEAAREEARKARSDHYPTLDLYASRTLSQSDTDVTINQRFDSTRFGLQLNLPLYAGGAVSSAVRETLANLRRAEGELEAAQLKLKLQIERDWHAFHSALASAKASRQTIDAARLAARAAQLGTKAGSATLADWANAIVQESDARRDLALANARALATWARLMNATDRLDEDSLANVDAVLSATAIASSIGGN